MLIDYLTARFPYELMPSGLPEKLRLMGDRNCRYCPKTGEVRYDSQCWESIRSDSHQITIRAGSDALWVAGSPARVCDRGDAVMGAAPSSTLDLPGCLSAIVDFLSVQTGHDLPRTPSQWIICRIDVTQNLKLDDLASVRVALRYLRDCEGGRYRVSQKSGDTVYWGGKSRLRRGKAYAKGPHIEYMLSRPDYTGCEYTDEEKALANKLLRLELTLGAQYIRERAGCPWYEITPEMLRGQWADYFNRMIGEATMKTDGDVKGRVLEAATRIVQEKYPNRSGKGQAQAAYSMWLLIQAEGWQAVKENTAERTWYRNLTILRAAGLGDMDISAGKVIPFRQKIIECQQVNTWDDLRKAA